VVQASILARSERSQVVLQTVVPSYNGDLRMMGKSEVLQEMRVPYQEALQKAEITAKDYKLRLKTVLDEGEPFTRILSLAEEENVDLIVITADRQNLLQKIPIGEITGKVISNSQKDILVVPAEANLRLERVLLAYDGSNDSKKALDVAIELSLNYGSELTIVTAYEVELEGFSYSPDIWDLEVQKAGDLQKKAAELAEKRGIRNLKTVLRHGKAAPEICSLAQSIHAGLIIIGCKAMNPMTKMLQGNVVGKVISNGLIPVWICKS
jgi:nucleotide-binding universal stress UspA family protein